jgi:very-short-patch-repair endonuclease
LRFSLEHRRKLSEAHKGKAPWNKGKKGFHWHSEVWKRVLSERWKGSRNPNWKPKVKLVCTYCGREFYVLPSKAKYRKFCSYECLKRFKKEHPLKNGFKKDNVPWNKGKHLDEEYRRKISEGTRNAMRNPVIKAKVVRGALIHLENSWKGFTSIERKLYDSMKSFGLNPRRQYKLYDGASLVGVVDFAFPEKKVIVECYGDYWHANPKLYGKRGLTETQKRVLARDQLKREWAKKNGWTFLAFYESDINNDSIKCVEQILEKLGSSSGYTIANKIQNVMEELNVTI